MTEQQNRAITIWLFIVVGLVAFLVVFGGYVRLTRSGLSIVEWNPISGVIPPIGQQAWEAEFAKYQQTPEYQHVNKNMTLEGYKRIFYVEWFHRLIARLAGLIVVIPLFYFLLRGYIPWRKSGPYLLIGLLFALQGFIGWLMVASGLVDRPAVSHFRLTIHLLTALTLFGFSFWLGLNHYYGFPKRAENATRSAPFRLTILTFVILLIQISYGGLVAGLKAGYVSNRWPLMGGRLIPPEVLSSTVAWWVNFLETPVTVHFVHRWFAFVVLIAALVLLRAVRRRRYSETLSKSVSALVILILVQISLGISVIWFGVPIWLALTHQGTALLLFLTTLFIAYRLVHEPVPYAGQLKHQLRAEPA